MPAGRADVAELAYALDSKSSDRKVMRVQLPPSAPRPSSGAARGAHPSIRASGPAEAQGRTQRLLAVEAAAAAAAAAAERRRDAVEAVGRSVAVLLEDSGA